MSNYTKSTNFATKDNLTPGDPLKVVRGTEIDTEYNNIATAIATKTDNASAAITGGAIDGATVGATTPATGSFTTLAASGTTTLAGALVGAVTQAAFNTTTTTLNLGGAATAVNLGAATGTATVNNTTLAAKAITASTTLAVTGTSTLTGAVTATAGVTGPITSSSVSITGGSITGITDLAVADGGTGASTAAGALNNLLPSQTSNANKYLQTDGTNATWDAVSLSTADITGTLGVANGGTGVTSSTGTGNVVLSNSPTLVTPALGTPSALVGTNITGTASGLTAGNVTTNANLTGAVTSVGNATSLGSFTSAQLATALTDETGSGANVFATSPTLVTPTLGVATATSLQGIIGNVTPAAGAFTTVDASGSVTLSGGTANGVTYLNGSKVLTSGSALQFDGTNLGIGVSPASILHLKGADPIQYFEDSSGTASFCSIQNANGVLDLQADNNATVASSAIKFSVDSAEGMRLTSTGLGIGTSSPAEKLHISSGASTCQIRIAGQSRNMYLGQDATGAIVYSDGAVPMLFYTNATERARIDSSGNLLVGTTNSFGKLVVYSSASTGATFKSVNNTAAGTGWEHFNGTSSNNNTQNIIIYGNGNIQNANNSYGALSDVKLKENIVDASPKLDKLCQVRVVNYNLKGNYEQHKQIGVIAQELEQIFPSMVDEAPDKDAENNILETTTKSVKYSVFVPMLIKAIQEQQALIQSLKARLDAANL